MPDHDLPLDSTSVRLPIRCPIRSQYEDFMRHVYTTGAAKTDRTGTGTRSVFGYQMRFDLTEGFHWSPPRRFLSKPSSRNCSGF